MLSREEDLTLETEKAVEQLKILHEELNRQRDTNAVRFSNMYLRASILIGATGVQSGIDFSKNRSQWQILSGIIYLLAASCGFWVMRPVKGRDGVLNQDRIKKWLEAPPYSVEYQIVMDNSEALKEDMKRLDCAGITLRIGYALLVCSWAVFALVSHFAK